MLKLSYNQFCEAWIYPAAFRRLCVETKATKCQPLRLRGPAAFRRLCVETGATCRLPVGYLSSRLQAAVC